MRYPLQSVLALGIALPVLATLVPSANAQAIRPTRTVTTDTATNTSTDPTTNAEAPATGSISGPFQTLPTAKISYEDLRSSYRVDTNASLSDIRADPKGNSGRIIEVTGKISGVMTSQTARNVVFDSNGGTFVFAAKGELNGIEFVTPGRAVRGLFLLSEDAGEVVLTPLALTENLQQPAPFRSPYDTTPSAEPEPPVVDMILPQPKPVLRAVPRPKTANGNNPKSIAPMAVRPTANADMSQSATYAALARRFNRKLTDAQANEIGTAILSASNRHSLDPRFLSTIIAVESDFDIYCLSSSGAMGLGQLMPFNLKPLGITNAWSPTQNIHGAARMLRQNLDSFSDRPDATLLAVAAYNAGPNAVKRAGYKVPNGQQVQRYVWKVYNQYKALAPELFASR